MARTARILVIAIAGSAAVAAATVALLLYGSLPRRDGRTVLPALTGAVTVELDARAIPRIRAGSLEDAFRAQGFMHAQERFFQMDLIRRSAAGELAALVGARANDYDAGQLRFEFRRRAREVVAGLPPLHAGWLAAYAEGVNAGLADLAVRPPEYLLVGAAPEPWLPEDSVLTGYAIYTRLSNNEFYERDQAVLAATLDPAVFSFLTPTTSRDDRPLLARAGDPTGGYRPEPLPPATAIDAAGAGVPPPASIVDPPMMGQAASNQWAVDSTRTRSGSAILANDPHLGFQLPNLFYRTELYWQDRAARGVSVPGLPGILLGANDAVAWGATVSYTDQSDWVVLEPDPAQPDRYLTPAGYRTIERREHARGEGSAPVVTGHTIFGPVMEPDGLGRPLALKATWLEPGGLTLDLLELTAAQSTAAALEIIGRWAGPSLSWSLAGSDGTVAWIVNGPIPDREGFDGSTPVAWSRGDIRWAGYRDPPQAPGGVDGAVFNANNRSLPMPEAVAMSRMFMRPSRAHRIAELLADRRDLDEQALFAMQLDTAAAAYEPVRALIVGVTGADETEPSLRTARDLAAGWNGRADADSAAFVLMQRTFRALLGRLIAPLLGPAHAADPGFVYRWPLAEETMLRILETRPPQLLPRQFPTWDDFLRDIVRVAVTADPRPGDTTWGDANRLNVGHPFAGIPLLGDRLRVPAVPQSGSPVSLRVTAPERGAVFRMVVAPDAPERGILELFGGQSGHFLSPNFLDQQADWAGGVPTPFLAGPAVSSFELGPD